MGELKGAEEQDRFKLTNVFHFPYLIFDSGKIYFLNKQAKKLLKETSAAPNTILNLDALGFADEGQKKEFKKNCNTALKSGKPAEITFSTKNKTTPSLVASVSTLVYGKKKCLQAVLTPAIAGGKSKNISAETVLKEIAANSLDVVFSMDFHPKSKITFISDSCEKLLGFTKEEIYKNPSILVPYLNEKDRNNPLNSQKGDLVDSKQTKEKKLQVHFKNKKGEIKLIEVLANPVFGRSKTPQGIVGSMRDITDRMLTEDLLVDAKSKFDLITNYGNDIITFFTYLPKEKYIYVSPNIEKVLGYKPEELEKDASFLRKKVYDDARSFDEGEELMRRCQKNGELKNYKHVYTSTNSKGERVWLENTSTPILNSKGKIGFYINIIKDVTEEKNKEFEIQKQYISYRELLDSSPAPQIIHDHGIVLYCNQQAQQLLGANSLNEVLGKNALDYFVGESKQKAAERINEIYKNKNLNRFNNYTIRDFGGQHIEVEIKSVFVKFENKDRVLSTINNLSKNRVLEIEKEKFKAATSHNLRLEVEIKEREEAEKNLIEKTAHLTSIFESSTHLIWTVNRAYQITSFNENFSKVIKLQHGIDVSLGDRIHEKLSEPNTAYADYWHPLYNEAFKGKKLEFEKKDVSENIGEVHRRVFINPIINEKGEVNEISCIANDITDSKLYEKKLINQTAKLTAIFDSSHHYIWTIDRQERLTSFNKNYFDIISALYNTKPYLGLVLNRGILSGDTDYNKLLKHHYKIAFEGMASTFEVDILDKNNRKVHLEVFLNPIFEKDKVIEVSGIAHNITEKKQTQQKIEASLKEKEVLLREVHHRVKNNMQVVSSILNLQSSYVSDEYALALLKESQNRIKTMAIIHESLYQNKSFSSVNFSEYVRTLISNIIHSYSHSKEKIKVDLNLENVILPLDSSIPAGLILNELVTNSIKHAFPGTRIGTITLDLKCEENLVFLELKDNGVGFSENVSFQNSHSLGLQLVNTLIEQIDGKYEFKSEKDIGTEIKVIFKM
ncbi:MAG: PAS domain S-box protein [Bacteroidia bacterium]|jgi:PAS domain S-box-containing protein|nr:PAS domain S-box protein [Bacteroidia bacterium]